MKTLNLKNLYLVNGGDKEDYDCGYKIGRAAKSVYNFAGKVYRKVKSWF